MRMSMGNLFAAIFCAVFAGMAIANNNAVIAALDMLFVGLNCVFVLVDLYVRDDEPA